MPDQQENPQPDDRKVPVTEKAWDSHIQAAQECGVAPHPKAQLRADRGP